MNNVLYKLIINAQNLDKNSMETLINRFEPIINSLASKLYYEYAKTDLIIYFIQFIYKTDFDKLRIKSDGCIVNYIKTTLYREYYKLCNQSIKDKKNEEVFQLDFIDVVQEYNEIDIKIFISQMVLKKVITQRHQDVLIMKFFYDYSDAQISQKLKISRQAINKINSKAISNIYKYVKDVM